MEPETKGAGSNKEETFHHYTGRDDVPQSEKGVCIKAFPEIS